MLKTTTSCILGILPSVLMTIGAIAQNQPKNGQSGNPPPPYQNLSDDSDKEALKRLRNIQLAVEQAYGAAYGVVLPFEKRSRAILEKSGFRIVESEGGDFDAILSIRASGTPLGSYYVKTKRESWVSPPKVLNASFHYTGADLWIRFSLTISGKDVFIGNSHYDVPPEDFVEEGTRTSPNDAPFEDLFLQGSIRYGFNIRHDLSWEDLGFSSRIIHMLADLYGAERVMPLLKRVESEKYQNDMTGWREDLDICRAAALALAMKGDERTAGLLLEALNDTAFDENIIMREALANLNSLTEVDPVIARHAVETLLTFMVRRKSGEASVVLSRLGTPAVQPLIDVLKEMSYDGDIRRWATEALVAMGSAAADPLIAVLKQNNLEVISSMYRFYIRKGVAGTEVHLIEALKKYGDNIMALIFFHSGNTLLETSAHQWAEEHAYSINPDLRLLEDWPKWGEAK